MAYLSIWLGIIIGYILRLFHYFVPARRTKKPRRISFSIVDGIRNVLRRIASLVCALYFAICSAISSARKKIRHKITSFKYSVRQWWSVQKANLLANANIYIMMKTASIYAKPGNTVRLITFRSVKEHCRINRDDYMLLEPVQDRPVCIPEYYELSDQQVELYPSPEIYLAGLHNVTISGASSIILTEHECLYDPFIEDTQERLDIKFSNVVGKIKEKLIVEMVPATKNIAEGIFLMGFASYNYYHFTVEIMSRLKYVDSFKEYRHLPLIVDSIMTEVPQFYEILQTFNCWHHPVITIKPNETMKVKHLIYPSYNTWMPINVKEREMILAKDFIMAKSGLDNIRSYLNLQPGPQERCIFISRKNLKATRLGNEAEIVDLFREYGFEIIHTEDLTYDEQVTLFHSAKCIAAASGAALTNIVYCQPQTDIVCIIPEEYRFFGYSTMAYQLQLHPIFLSARVTQKTAYTASDIFELDPAYCRRFLQNYKQAGISAAH